MTIDKSCTWTCALPDTFFSNQLINLLLQFSVICKIHLIRRQIRKNWSKDELKGMLDVPHRSKLFQDKVCKIMKQLSDLRGLALSLLNTSGSFVSRHKAIHYSHLFASNFRRSHWEDMCNCESSCLYFVIFYQGAVRLSNHSQLSQQKSVASITSQLINLHHSLFCSFNDNLHHPLLESYLSLRP